MIEFAKYIPTLIPCITVTSHTHNGASHHRQLHCFFNSFFTPISKRYQNSTLLIFVRGIHRSPMDFPHKGPVMRRKDHEHISKGCHIVLLARSCMYRHRISLIHGLRVNWKVRTTELFPIVDTWSKPILVDKKAGPKRCAFHEIVLEKWGSNSEHVLYVSCGHKLL